MNRAETTVLKVPDPEFFNAGSAVMPNA